MPLAAYEEILDGGHGERVERKLETGLRGRVHSKIQTQKPRVSVRVQVKLSEPYNHVPTPDGLLSPEVWSITLCSGYMWNKTLK